MTRSEGGVAAETRRGVGARNRVISVSDVNKGVLEGTSNRARDLEE